MQPGLSQCRDAVSAHGEAEQGAQRHGSAAHPEKAHGRQRPEAEHARNEAALVRDVEQRGEHLQ